MAKKIEKKSVKKANGVTKKIVKKEPIKLSKAQLKSFRKVYWEEKENRTEFVRKHIQKVAAS